MEGGGGAISQEKGGGGTQIIRQHRNSGTLYIQYNTHCTIRTILRVVLITACQSYPRGYNLSITKRCRLSWLTNSALVNEPKCGGGRELRVSANEYSCAHGAQRNFGDLTPYLTYGLTSLLLNIFFFKGVEFFEIFMFI